METPCEEEGIKPSTEAGLETNEDEKEQRGNEKQTESTHSDSEGASAGETPPIVEDLTIKGVTKCGAGGAASRAGYEASENGSCGAAAHGADWTAERTYDSVGFGA